jgi:hypothetical protein
MLPIARPRLVPQQLDACLRDHRLTSSAPPPAISKDAKRSMILFDTNLS